jgi:hypothetical protein
MLRKRGTSPTHTSFILLYNFIFLRNVSGQKSISLFIQRTSIPRDFYNLFSVINKLILIKDIDRERG